MVERTNYPYVMVEKGPYAGKIGKLIPNPDPNAIYENVIIDGYDRRIDEDFIRLATEDEINKLLLKKKSLLLITSDKVGDTGTISFSYIFQDKSMEAFDKHPKQCSGPFGFVKNEGSDTSGVFYANVFQGGQGLVFAGPIYGTRHLELDSSYAESNKKLVEDTFPDNFNMLCTTKVAEEIQKVLAELCEVSMLKSEETLLTAK